VRDSCATPEDTHLDAFTGFRVAYFFHRDVSDGHAPRGTTQVTVLARRASNNCRSCEMPAGTLQGLFGVVYRFENEHLLTPRGG